MILRPPNFFACSYATYINPEQHSNVNTRPSYWRCRRKPPSGRASAGRLSYWGTSQRKLGERTPSEGGECSRLVNSLESPTWGSELIDESSLHHSTLDAAYTRLIGSIEESAQDHVVFADRIGTEIVEAAKLLGGKHEEMKKKVR